MSEEKFTREQRKRVREVKKRSGVIVEVDGAQDKRGLSRRYDVDLAGRSCTCPAWRFQKKPISERTCKHLDAALRKDEGMWDKPDEAYIEHSCETLAPLGECHRCDLNRDEMDNQ